MKLEREGRLGEGERTRFMGTKMTCRQKKSRWKSQMGEERKRRRENRRTFDPADLAMF